MGYLVSFLGGALGFAVWDKKNSTQPAFNLAAAAVQGIIIYLVLGIGDFHKVGSINSAKSLPLCNLYFLD